jgi:hypothetical protein
VGAAGAGPEGGVTSTIDASLSGSGIIEPTGTAGAGSASATLNGSLGVPTGGAAAIKRHVGGLVVGAVAVGVALL